MSGDASERCDVGVSLNKSFLFLQTLAACAGGSNLSGRRGLWKAVIARSSSKGGRGAPLWRPLMR